MTTTIGRQSTRRSEEHTSELQSRQYLVCRLLLEKSDFDMMLKDDAVRPFLEHIYQPYLVSFLDDCITLPVLLSTLSPQHNVYTYLSFPSSHLHTVFFFFIDTVPPDPHSLPQRALAPL